MFIREHLSSPFADGIMAFISALGNGGFIWIIISLLFILNKKTRKWGIFMWLSMFMCLIFGNIIIKNLVARIRPYQLYNVPIIIPPPSEYSFPSGHTLSSFSCAVALYKCHKIYGIIALIFACIMGFTRLYLFVHYPTDILGGIALSFVMVYFAEKTMDFIEKKHKKVRL